MNQNMKISNIAEMYRAASLQYGSRTAFATKNRDKQYEAESFRDLYEKGLHLATALIDLGVKQRDHLALLADNCLEWIIADYGTQISGAVDVPRGTDVTDNEIRYILTHSDSKMAFVENEAMLEKVQRNLSKTPNIKKIILMDKNAKASGKVLHLYDLIAKGKELREKGDRRAEERIENIQPDDLFTLIYTSGTTGEPKGVMLTHANMVSQVRNIPINIGPEDKMLSILPIWHIFERVFEMIAIYSGAGTYYTNIRTIKEDLKTVAPTFMASAPRLWESVYLGILNNVKKSPPVKQKLFGAAYFCAERYNDAFRFLTGKKLDLEGRSFATSMNLALKSLFDLVLFAVPFFLLDTVVLKKIRAATGGKLRGTVSGGGALPLHVDLFFNNIGIPVLEGYGMTETSPVLAVRIFSRLIIGSVGPIYPETELRLVEIGSGKIIYPPVESGRGKQGEIHVRGPQVMKGYYKNPEATEKVLRDGWMNTGDLGVITFNNTLKLVGRSKETIVLLGGENLEPVPIETKIQQSPMVDQVMVVGQDKKFVCALIVPSLEPFQSYGSTLEELSKNEEVYKEIKQEIKNLINQESGYKSFERVIDIRILAKPFEVGDELTNIFKLKRHVITKKYHDLIESMYQ